MVRMANFGALRLWFAQLSQDEKYKLYGIGAVLTISGLLLSLCTLNRALRILGIFAAIPVLCHLTKPLFLKALFLGNTKLFSFWMSNLHQLMRTLPPELTHFDSLAKRMAIKKPFTVNVDKAFINKYNKNMKEMADYIKQIHSSSTPLPFETRQMLFFMVRLLVIISTFAANSPLLSFGISLLQFAVLPYSLFVSIGYGLETAVMLFSGHVIIFPILKYLVDLICPHYLNVSIPFSPLFLAVFLALDQIICALCLYKTPKGKTKKVSLDRIWESVWYGFLNCKTYYLVLFSLLSGQKQSIPLTVWCIDSMLGISTIISGHIRSYWELMFYHVHRMGHLPFVYPDAHKFHHYLRDTTAFDAHIFGSGAPEEWLLIIIEYVIATQICGGLPPSLSYSVLCVSWYNKWGFHTRNDKDEYHADNFHADHHAKHNVNFGFEYPLEMVMKTTSNRDHLFNGYKIKRVELDSVISLQFTPYSDE